MPVSFPALPEKSICDTSELTEFCDNLREAGETVLGLDTEFYRERSYYPELCLVQLASRREVCIVDCLAPDIDLSPLDGLLLDESITKVFHAGRQDIEIFFLRLEKFPRPFFDTQIAAMACGFGDQVSLSRLIEVLFEVKIDKDTRYSDWRKRPLSASQISYAAMDALYLPEIHLQLTTKLEELNRQDWIIEALEKLSDPSLYKISPDDAWRKVKAGRRLNKRNNAILKEVAGCRELQAQKKNLPRGFICSDRQLVDMVLQKPKDKRALSKIAGLSEKFVSSEQGTKFLEAIETALHLPLSDARPTEEKAFLTSAHEEALDMLKLLLKHRCREEKFSSQLVASRNDLADLVLRGTKADIPTLSGWRYDFFGREALDLLAGKISLRLSDNRLLLTREDEGPEN